MSELPRRAFGNNPVNALAAPAATWRTRLALLALGLLPAAVASAAGQGLEYVQAHYTKYEYQIPMRDGVRLFTAVYVPKDASKPYPILLNRSPYSVSPYGEDRYRENLGPSARFGEAGYIVVYQDVRGCWMSEGQFVNMRPQRTSHQDAAETDESTDTYDTIEWLVKHVPNHNGCVGQWGISYPGFYTAAGMIDAHPALKASSPQAPIVDWFIGDDWHHNGALLLPHAFNFMATFGRPRPEPTKQREFRFDHGTPDGYRFFLELGPLTNADARYFKGDVAFWNEVMQHGTYDDFWKARNLRPHLKNIRPAVMTVGGWFDAENLFGALETYKNVESQSPGANNVLVMGPWTHGGWSRGDGDRVGDVSFRSKTAEFYRTEIEFPFFEHHLRGEGEARNPEAWVFETGTDQWRQYDAWPPRDVRRAALYLAESGQLRWEPGGSSHEAFDEYTSDPARPVPYLNKTVIGMTGDYMSADQRFAGERTDVLVYETPPLEADVALAGPVTVELHVSTTGTDADFVVKLIDVYPNDYPDPDPNPRDIRRGGFQQMVRGDVMRGKFRRSFAKPEPFQPGQPDVVRFTMPDVCHSFRAGHRIMIQVQSSWFPLIDRNPQKFVDIYSASADDFQKATHRVYRSAERPSRIEVLVRGP